jgi:hypothetical protein
MNKIIVLILLIFLIVYFMFTFDVYVIKKNKLLCTPMHIYHNYKPNIVTNGINKNEDVIRIKGINNNDVINENIITFHQDISQETYNKIKKQLQ